MGYYDFNESFWSPSEVCAPVKQETRESSSSKFGKFIDNIFTGCVNGCKGIRRAIFTDD